MRVMNAIGYAPPSLRPQPRRRAQRIETVTLASSISIVALLTATVLHVVVGVQEVPLVVGTIIVASIAGWVNAYRPADASAPSDGGHDLVDDADVDVDLDWYDRAA